MTIPSAPDNSSNPDMGDQQEPASLYPTPPPPPAQPEPGQAQPDPSPWSQPQPAAQTYPTQSVPAQQPGQAYGQSQAQAYNQGGVQGYQQPPAPAAYGPGGMQQYPQAPQQAYAPQGDHVDSIGSWMLAIFLAAIPFVGFIYLLVIAFGGTASDARRNWARAAFVWMLVGMGLVLFLSLTTGAFFGGLLSNTR
ncbi:MAG: hypothetical protein Q4Q03_02970 [Bowdeniella nasicola]|nr:hypothetical protein [Bowdeniella nasicola]